jgi:GT2 family glycosyltransferase
MYLAAILRGRGEAIWSKGFFVHRRGEVDKDDTAWVSGGSGAFRKTLWKKLGGLDEIYNPFYWEDIDLSYRAMKSGYSLVFEPKSSVIHKHEQGSIKTSTKEDNIKKIAFRNQLLFIWKNITDVPFIVEHVCYLPLQLLRSLLSGDTTYLSGFFHAIMLLPAVLKKRKEGNITFVMNDKQLLRRKFHE